ncbi:MAG: hypothetical protein HOP33_21855 [Verrucomicrobia bacterium]|nr:hypothetical protein [Verrucomicrobiota bacterium]
MAKNRKNQPASIRFGQAMKVVLLCALIGGPGVGYVWQKGQLDQLGRDIKEHEARVQGLVEQNKKLRNQLGLMRSPTQLDLRVREMNLGLGLPRPVDVWRLTEPEASVPAATPPVTPTLPVDARHRQYASQNNPRL